MRVKVTMDQALATVEQFEVMCENEGVQIEATFVVSRADLFGVAKMMDLEVNDYTVIFGHEDVKCAYWNPNDRENLTVSFYSHEPKQ